MTGTYRRDDVVLLLDEATDAPRVEYMPSEKYFASVRLLVDRAAPLVAQLSATLGDRLVERRGRGVVLVSIARAGVPIGILVKRWLRLRYSVAAPHYGVSVSAGLIDESAVKWICRRHPPGDLQFLDAWTSKGTVQETLWRASARWQIANLDPALAVLVDPACCAQTFATRKDVLLPSACLGAAMSGLLGATSPGLTPGGFHLATVSREMTDIDLTETFLSAVTIHLEAMAASRPVAGTRVSPASDDPRAWGRDHAVALARRYRAEDLDLVNVGICETTRAFFRRWPKLLIVNPRRAGPELHHLLQLARERAVPIAQDATIPFQAALI